MTSLGFVTSSGATARRKYLASATLGAALLLAGCSAGLTTAAAAPSVPPAVSVSPPVSMPPAASASMSPGDVCATWADLKQSISGLSSINIVGGGIGTLQSALDDIRNKLDAFQASASNEFSDQIAALRTAVSNLQTSLSTAGASPSASTIARVVAGVAAVLSSFNTLRAAVSTRCG